MKSFRHAARLSVAGVALWLSSCAYDPNLYTSTTVSSGYGYGYGYGGSTFSTTYFVSTGDPYWGYDPYVRSYYCYRTRRYYDPYLYGYYPVGYRPPVIVGVPHPRGWDASRRWCPPPSRVVNTQLVSYNNRYDAYRRSNHSWSRDIRQEPRPSGRPSQGGGRPGWEGDRPAQGGNRPTWGGERPSQGGGSVNAPQSRPMNSLERRFGRPMFDSPASQPAPQAVPPSPPLREERSFDSGGGRASGWRGQESGGGGFRGSGGGGRSPRGLGEGGEG